MHRILRGTLRTSGAIGLIVVVAALLTPAAAGSIRANAGGPQSWAFGASDWTNETAISSIYSETYRAYVGEQIITTLTNVSSTVSEMNEVSTIAESYYTQFCEPNCASPTLSENFSETYLEVVSEWLNLTSAATVHEGATTATAFGILNASSVYTENLTELYNGQKGGSLYYKGHYYLSYDANTAITFSPALGLIPAKSSTGLTWNSTSAYQANGGWSESANYNFTEPAIGYNYQYQEPSFTGSDTLAGNETIQGKDLGAVSLSGGGSARSIELAYTGAYDIALGYLITPAGTHEFAGNSGWSVGVEPAALSASTVDVATTSDGSNSPQVVGASTNWTVGPSTPPGMPSGSSSPSQSAAPTTSGTVQAEPEPLPYAVATTKCLTAACPSGARPIAPSPTASTGWGEFAIAVGLAGAAAAVLTVLAMRRRGGGAVRWAASPPSNGTRRSSP